MAQSITPDNELEFLYKRIRDHTNELMVETAANEEGKFASLAADQGHAMRIVVGEGLIAIAKAIENQSRPPRTPLDHSKVVHE